MAKRDEFLMELSKHNLKKRRIGIPEIQTILLKLNIIEGWRRKDFIKWLEAKEYILHIEGSALYKLNLPSVQKSEKDV